MRRTHVALLIAALLHAAPSHSQDYCPQSVTDRPRIGLVLSGGGARGIAHIGVLRVLEELHIPIDYVAGTSGGAIIGGLYATGMDSAQIEHVIRAIDWTDLFVDDTQRAEWPFERKRDDELALFGPKFGVGPNSSLLPKGAINGQKVITYFQGVVSQRVQNKDFDDLPIPFRAVAADLVSAQPVILDHGDLATAMRISASIPGVFLPMRFEHRLLVDGGIVDNLPIDVVKAMGADIVIAVDVSTPLSSEDQLNDFLAITNQLSNILVVHNTTEEKRLLGPHDVLIEPPLGDQISSIDFEKADLSIPIGYRAADALRTRLASLGLSEDAYAAYRAGIERCVGGAPTIEFVELDNRSRFDDAVLRKLLHVEIGQPFDRAQLDRDMQHIYALGFLDLSTYEIVEKNGRKGIRVSVQQDSRGRNFLETGFDFYGDSGSSAIELRLAYLKTDVDRRGAEFRGLLQVGENQGLLAELYKPMTDTLRLILLPRLFATRRQLDIFDGSGDRISQVNVEQGGGSLALGREFARHAALFGGVRRYTGNIKVEIGDPNVPKGEFDGGEWFVDGTFDRLDDRDFPSYGTLAGAEYLWSRQSLDANTDFEQLLGSVLHADTWDRHTLILGSRFGLTMQGTAPTQSLFRGGGIFNLSGYEPDELTGQNFAMALVGYRYRLFKSGWVPPYIGATVEYGNAAEDRQDVFDHGIWNGSVFFAFDLPIGPLYAGWGFAENSHNAFFVRIGNIFGSNALLR